MKYLFTALLVIFLFSSFAQKRKKVNWTTWSDSTAFFEGKIPVVTGYGHYSDSLSNVHGNKTFFIANGVYYVINNAADYYLWFTNKYPYLFDESIDSYRFFYIEKDNYNMLRYIEHTYNGGKRPLKFKITNDYYSPKISLEHKLRYTKYVR